MDEKMLLEAIGKMMDEKLKESSQTLKKEIVNEVNVLLEAGVEKQIKIIAEGHKDILDRLPEAEEQAQLKSRVRVLERVVIDLRNELEALKKAQ